eukprot:TRINITY_DN10040_c0_g1_i2.p1 TRINITY_DN10040_c0_g1~~TRINITY_DN10040_c0_g1_i2.p1  ORF type:complete len:151 (+),score=5.75 TRINITY_DN10040_c0_g1_i2:195-647(+)
MSLLCVKKVFRTWSDLGKARDLIPLLQFIGLTYVWRHTAFYQQYTLLAVVSLSILFYLLNGKLVLSFVTQTKIKLLHLELLYLLVPAGILVAEKAKWIDTKTCDSLQIKVGILIFILHIERLLTCSLSIGFQVSKYLGLSFFEISNRKDQ